jgi:hypothetical protein
VDPILRTNFRVTEERFFAPGLGGLYPVGSEVDSHGRFLFQRRVTSLLVEKMQILLNAEPSFVLVRIGVKKNFLVLQT